MKLKLRIFATVLHSVQNCIKTYDQRFYCAIHGTHTHTKNMYVYAFLNSYLRSRQTYFSFVSSVSNFFSLIWDTMVFSSIIWCICISNRANTVSFTFLYGCVCSQDRNDFLLFVHYINLSLCICIARISIGMYIFIFHFFSFKLFTYVFNVDSLCANVYNNSKYHCALFLKRFEFVSIMTIDAFEISKVFFFYNEKIVRERERRLTDKNGIHFSLLLLITYKASHLQIKSYRAEHIYWKDQLCILCSISVSVLQICVRVLVFGFRETKAVNI